MLYKSNSVFFNFAINILYRNKYSFLKINIDRLYYSFKRKNLPALKEIVVSGETALKIAEALNSTTLRMLQVLGCERLDVTTISKRLGLSEAYISEQVRLLEELKLINVTYERGKRGIRKVCESAVEKVTIVVINGCLSSTSRSTDEKSTFS